MLFNIALLTAGIALLVWSADRFTEGAAAIASNLGVSRLVVGLTIVAIGSSAPEILVSVMASLRGNHELAVGNALGSNIANVGMVLGITALVRPLVVDSGTLRREIPILLGVMALAGLLLWDLKLGLLDGTALLLGLVIYIFWLIMLGTRSRVNQDLMLQEIVEELPDAMSTGKAVFWTLVGGTLLIFSSDIMVDGATGIARHFGVSDLIIGLTVVAIGTSLPELAASVAGVLKNEHEIAIGNVIGSNIFNLLAVMGLPGVLGGVVLGESVLSRDYLLMLGLAVAMTALAYRRNGPGKINRIEGAMLLMVFIGYQYYLYYGGA